MFDAITATCVLQHTINKVTNQAMTGTETQEPASLLNGSLHQRL